MRNRKKIASKCQCKTEWTLKSARIDRKQQKDPTNASYNMMTKNYEKNDGKKNSGIIIKCTKTTNNAKIGAFVATDDIYLEHVTIINYLMHAELFGVCTLQICVSRFSV